MTDFLIFVLFFLVDFVLSTTGLTVYLLLLVPPYLFVRNYPSGVILYGGGGAVFLSELLHQHALGSFMLGVGLALFLFHLMLDVINWHHYLPQVTSLLLYFLVLIVTRLLVVRVLHSQWVLPSLIPLAVTYAVGVLLITYRFSRLGGRTGRSSGPDDF